MPVIKQPSLFLPHGAPDLPLTQEPAATFLRALSTGLPAKPKGIVIISAHWETKGLSLTSAPELETIYDFGGFAPELYEIQYPAKIALWLVEAVTNQLMAQGEKVHLDPKRGLDHGAWVPLMLAFPQADIPIVQLSLDMSKSLEDLFQLGRDLQALREQGILILGSGGLVHNLRLVDFHQGPVPQWAQDFENWLDETIISQDWPSLFTYRDIAPNAKQAHPTDEHLRPLLITLGASDEAQPPKKLHTSFTYGSISMASWG